MQKINEKTEIQLYEEAIGLLNKKKYRQAIKNFQEIEDLYPFSHWAMKAKLQSALTSYTISDYNKAAGILDEYIQMYPNDKDIAGAYYLRVLSYYMQINDIEREQKTAYITMELLKEYTRLFPDSEYISDLEGKIDLVTNHIAAQEFSVSKFYLERGNYIAAIKRFKTIINNYHNSNYVPEALYRLAEAYLALGIKAESGKCIDILNEDFPNSIWNSYGINFIESKVSKPLQ